MKRKRVGVFGYLCAGFISSGISCSLYVSCGLGADAFNLMTRGISRTLEIPAGNAFYTIQGTMLLLVFCCGAGRLDWGRCLVRSWWERS